MTIGSPMFGYINVRPMNSGAGLPALGGSAVSSVCLTSTRLLIAMSDASLCGTSSVDSRTLARPAMASKTMASIV